MRRRAFSSSRSRYSARGTASPPAACPWRRVGVESVQLALAACGRCLGLVAESGRSEPNQAQQEHRDRGNLDFGYEHGVRHSFGNEKNRHRNGTGLRRPGRQAGQDL